MSTARVSRGEDSTGAKEFRGQWWLPSRPENLVAGTLTVTSPGYPQLHLIGGLDLDGDDGPKTVLGIADGLTLVTILSASFLSQTEAADGVASQTATCFGIMVGGHFPEGPASEYVAVSVQSAHLGPWVDKPKPRVDWDLMDDRRLSIQVEVPDTLSCALPGLGELSLEWRVSGRSGQDASVTIRPIWHLKATDAISEETAWRKFVTPLLFFTSFATGEGDALTEVRLYAQAADEEGPNPGAELLGTLWSEELEPSVERPGFLRDFLRFRELEPVFSTVMPAWFRLYDRTRAALLDFFAVDLTKGLFAEEEFSRVARSLEVWHRATVERTYMPPDEFEELMGLLRSAVNKKQRGFIDMRLKYGNEPTFKQRIDELISMAGAPVSELVAEFPRFSRRVTDARNALTHQAELGVAFTDEQMFYAQRVLQLVFRSVLMRELGYAGAELDAAVKRTGSWRWAASPKNPLRREVRAP